MKVKCLHGYFIFDEIRAGEVSDFVSLFGLEIVRKDKIFTFADLEDFPDYSIKGKALLNTVATKTFSGRPWEILRANGLIYNFNTGLLELIGTITQLVKLDAAGNYYLSPGLILPGSITDDGSRVTEYAAWFTNDTMKFKYSEVTSE